MNYKTHSLFAVFTLVVALVVPANAEIRVSNPLQARLLDDVADGRLDQFTLWQAALIAGRDLSDEEFARSVRQFDGVINRLRISASSEGARGLFERMHREVLVGEYRSGQNDLNRLLENGDYNCVTATILYQAACESVGLRTVAVAAPAHVFCRLLEDIPGDVETTCPTWFAEKAKRQAPRSGRSISRIQLIGKIFYNRGVHLLEHERFDEALNQLEISLRFDADDPTAHANRLAALNNWALYESSRKQYAAATQLLRQGMQLDAAYSPFLANDLHVHQQWVRDLCQQHHEAEAIALLLSRQVDRPNAALFRDGPLAIYRLWLQRVAPSDFSQHAASLAAARSHLDPTQVSHEERAILGPERASRLAGIRTN